MENDYSGMKLDFTVKGNVSITTFDYIKNTLDKLPIEMTGVKVTPLTHLFEVNESCLKLKTSEVELIHTQKCCQVVILMQACTARHSNSSCLPMHLGQIPRPR